ncbi:autophagy-related protein 2 isoform X2 [Euphorbia lathyris]|uniref:autophagy-related protein 2 isoform X2 n=1 Tax=Euphorbia lathyris TaxID=212925 RepID=UPI00331355DF
MFSWNLAKSAEAMFSRWSVKRLFQFLLKKKLGQFILGDIDLDQLDVQLSHGKIQLNDLALNVDYINDKVGAATPVMIKEGSIGSLSVKMPWKDKGFQIEVDELEIVVTFTSFPRNKSSSVDEKNRTSEDSSTLHKQSEEAKDGHDMMDSGAKSSSADVHEGVKTIAKMVKWFLTSFNVKVKKLIVAFEPGSRVDEKVGHQKILVLRISEIECGTCVSDDPQNSDARAESILGISQLTNFITFRGAVLELLKMDDGSNETCAGGLTHSSIGELRSGHCSSNATPIFTGSKDGFSGNLKLSIPWKNGFLDIRKVDANVSIDPVELKLQPHTIKWVLLLWETYKTLDDEIHKKSADSVDLNLASHLHSSTLAPSMVTADETIPMDGSFSSAFSSLTLQESRSEAMLPGPHLIPDWVPNSVRKNDSQDELDLGASVDQFFECFDGIRSSQLALGSSGMLKWTCSVFSALTAASNLASGSLHIPSEQQHVQTNLKATLAGISIILSFQDEEQEYWFDPKSKVRSCSDVHYVVAECNSIFLSLQVCLQKMRFEGEVKHIEVADYSFMVNDVMNLCPGSGSRGSTCQTLSIQHLQDEVQGALPPFASFVEDPYSDKLNAQNASDAFFRNMTKMKLLSTSGVTRCEFAINSDSINLKGAKSFSLQLPHFIFWVNLWSINTLLDLLKDMGKYVEMNSERGELSPVNQKHGLSAGDLKKGSSSTANLKGCILIPSARMIMCFSVGTDKDTGNCFSWNQFIAIDLSSQSTLEKGKFQNSGSLSDVNCGRRYTSKATCSLHLNTGDLKAYLVNQTCKSDAEINSCGLRIQKFFAEQILSVSSRADYPSSVSLLWQEGSVTGPWIFERAKSLATSEESRSKKKSCVKGYEFASVTSVKDMGMRTSQIREEMILSSVFCLHIRLFSVTLDLCSTQYHNLLNLLEQTMNGLSGAAGSTANVDDAFSVSQTSILMECESVEILIRPDMKEDIKSSLQYELPGSWNCMKLKVQKLDMLTVSNIGGIGGANFFWLAHGQGKLWGSITGAPGKEFLLISCSNSTRKRGDGGGSNVLSSRFAGSDIVHLSDPKNLHEYMCITIRCGTIVAPGGRLDWLDAISSFFSRSSHEVKKVDDDKLPKGDLKGAPCGSTFILKLVDIGLSYEPHLKNSMLKDVNPESSSSSFKDEAGEPYVYCLLAASSLTFLNTTEESADSYKISVQDIGFLLCAASENLGGTYSAEYLHKMGYVKVAREALLEAILRTNCKNGLSWELECSESHIYLETCHDTTSGLMRLGAQLQQLFAPDLEESIVHLQTRWKNVHQAQQGNELNGEGGLYSSSSISEKHASIINSSDKHGIVGLMDEICEDAFCLDGSPDRQFDSDESRASVSFEESLLGEVYGLNIGTPVSDDLSHDISVPLIGLESSQTSYLQSGTLPELIEGYCLSELRPLSELSMGRQSVPQNLKFQSKIFGDGDLGRGNSGWYKDASVSIVENHIPESSGGASLNQILEDELPSFDGLGPDDLGKPTGRALLKNINVTWRMFAGSDWHAQGKNKEPSRGIHGRDTTAYLELVLSGIQFQYNFFPVDGVCASKLSFSVKDFYLYDRSKSAPWKRVLGYYCSKDHPRESSSKALKLELETVRPNPVTPLEEYRLRVALLPMLLQLHQSQLDFLISFFGTKSLSTDQSSDHNQNSYGAKSSLVNNLAGENIADEALLPYFQMFDVSPIVIRIDYSPRHVDLAALGGGKYVELVNVVPWKGVELQLKHVHAVGVYGWGTVCETIVGEWLEDISQNQIHKVLQGLPTIRSLVAVGSSAAKLISLPVESYRKDQRVLRGMQRGTIAFLRSISLEAVGLGVHLAAGAHDILVQAECILTRIPRPVTRPAKGNTKRNVRCNQPKNAQQGIQQNHFELAKRTACSLQDRKK